MADKNTKLTEILLDYPSLVKVFKPYTFSYLKDDSLTLGEIASNNKLDVEGFVKETNELLKEEPSRDLSSKSVSDLITLVEETYFEDILDEAPVLDVYVNKFIKDKHTNGKEIKEKFKLMMELTNEYINYSNETLHRLTKVAEENGDKETLPPQIAHRDQIKDNLLDALSDLRKSSNHFVTVDDDADVQFLFNRMNAIEDTILDMILIENDVYKKAVE